MANASWKQDKAVRNDDLLLLVGKLNYAWTNTESLLIYVIAHLMKTSKEAAIVAFLTLNTSRARLDFIERLAKMGSTETETRSRLLDLSSRLKSALKMRNKYNHCVYSFDSAGQLESTQLFKIADFGKELKYGKIETIDNEEISRIEGTLSDITRINREILDFFKDNKIDL